MKKNDRVGRLVLLEQTRNNSNHVAWLCRCDCGAEKIIATHNLGKGVMGLDKGTYSCGCFQREQRFHRPIRTHGKTKTPEYYAWNNMKSRCANKTHQAYKNYGGRGIEVCERWEKFENFLTDMGIRPSPVHSLERKNVNGNYEPNNCKWGTPSEQQRNRRPRHLWDKKMRGSTSPGLAAARHAIAMLSFGT